MTDYHTATPTGINSNIAMRYAAGAAQLQQSETITEIDAALDSLAYIHVRDAALVEKAYNVVCNKAADTCLRVKALGKLHRCLHSNEAAVSGLIAIMEDDGEAKAMRRAAVHALMAGSFNAPALAAQLPAYKHALRQLLKSDDTDLAQAAVIKLAAYNDEAAMQLLLRGLADPDKALVPDEKAIPLLGMHGNAVHYAAIRAVLARTKSQVVMLEAVYALGGDVASRYIIMEVLGDAGNSREVHRACRLAMGN